jgi:HAD superfamily hydrolase (TIGR01549 family)
MTGRDDDGTDPAAGAGGDGDASPDAGGTDARYDAVVLDNDGVLTHPTPMDVLRRALREAFAAFDVEVSPAEVEALPTAGPDDLRVLCERYGVDPAALWARREARAAEAQRAAMASGEKPLYDDVDALRDLSVPLGVVSNNQHATVEHVLSVFDVGDLFATAHGRDPTVEGFARRKPAPHYLERALADLDVDATRTLYVGDSTVDVQAAAAVGADAAFVRRPHREGYDVGATPTYEVRSLRDVVDVARGEDSGV